MLMGCCSVSLALLSQTTDTEFLFGTLFFFQLSLPPSSSLCSRLDGAESRDDTPDSAFKEKVHEHTMEWINPQGLCFLLNEKKTK